MSSNTLETIKPRATYPLAPKSDLILREDGSIVSLTDTIRSVGYGGGNVDLSNYYNKDETESKLLEKVDIRPKKSFIVCIAGQSNAVGYDESPVLEYVCKNLNENRLRQLGIYGEDNLKNIPLGHHAHSFQNLTNINNPNSPDKLGTKGLHLPLGNLLLNEIPEDYEVLFVSATYGGTGFNSGSTGTYDATEMLPSSGTLKWSTTSPYFYSMRDRIKYALDLNEDNLFGGVIWIQGENDRANASNHYTAFQSMTEAFFEYFNNNGYGGRTAKGVFDKNLWYNVETVAYWYSQGECEQIWQNYKNWNPNTYVEIPRDTDSNAVNGTGSTSSTRASHFGNDAYTRVVAPRVFSKMLQNGGLFKRVVEDKETSTPVNAVDVLGFDRSLDPTKSDATEESFEGVGDLASFTFTDKTLVLDNNPNAYDSVIMFKDAYSIDFETTRQIYWIIFRGDCTDKVAMLGLGAAFTANLTETYLEQNSMSRIVRTTPSDIEQYTLQLGDRVSVYRGNDGVITVYLKKNTETKYNLWFKFDQTKYSYSCEDVGILGVIVGVSSQEPINGDKKTVLKDAKIQKNQGFVNNPELDILIHNTIVDVLERN